VPILTIDFQKQDAPPADLSEQEVTIKADIRTLPDFLIKQILADHIPQKEILTIMAQFPDLKPIAELSLSVRLELEDRNELEALMRCKPDPTQFSVLVRRLSIPGSLTSPAKEYIEQLLANTHPAEFRTLIVGRRDSNDERDPYIPRLPRNSSIRTLFVGAHSTTPLDPGKDRFVNIDKELRQQPFRYLERLHWNLVDPRLGNMHSLLARVDSLCPQLEYLQIGWNNVVDIPMSNSAYVSALRSLLPPFNHLKHMTFRFDHRSVINVPVFVYYLRAFYHRGVAVKVNSCAVESVRWRMDMYDELCRQGQLYEYNKIPLLTWTIQNNRHHLIILDANTVQPQLKEAMLSALEDVSFRDGSLLRLQIELVKYMTLPPILLSGNLKYLRILVNRANIDPRYIPAILEANPHLKNLVVVLHVFHCGSSYDGNCTNNKIPLIPSQTGGHTVPAFDMKYSVRRLDTPSSISGSQQDTPSMPTLSQKWASYPYSRIERRRIENKALTLPELNIFDQPRWQPDNWSPDLLQRVHDFEAEIKGYFTVHPKLSNVSIILNTDPDKFGQVEQYWCCCERS